MKKLFKLTAALCIAAMVGCSSDGTKTDPPPIADQISIAQVEPDKAQAVVGKPYEQTLTVKGGNGPVTWTLKAPTPEYDWLSIDAATGTLHGTPTAPLEGTDKPVTVQVTDANGNKADIKISLSILPCTDGDTTDCYTKLGSDCMKGIKTCKNKVYGNCEPSSEKADAKKCAEAACASCGKRGQCLDGQCQCGDGPPCAEGLSCCNGKCVNTDIDLENCGGCGPDNACETDRTNVSPTCVAGTCNYPCETGWKRCPEGSSERDCSTNILTEKYNCGGCGQTCERNDDLHVVDGNCESGQCSLKCTDTFLNCDNNAGNGCERDMNKDENNCDCGNNCTMGSGNAKGVACDANTHQCKVYGCPPDTADCNGRAHDGCEAWFGSDESCGGCGIKCPKSNAGALHFLHASGDSTCKNVNGHFRCVYQEGACAAGYMDFDNNASNGCELNITTQWHCGRQNIDCFAAHPGANVSWWKCDWNTSTCSVGSCNYGWADCTNKPGCETQLFTNSHCSSCQSNCGTDGSCETCTSSDYGCVNGHKCVSDKSGGK